MFKSTREFDEAVATVLKILCDTGSLENASNMDTNDYYDCLEHIVHNRFIIGVDGTRDAAGAFITSITFNPRITRSGLDLIERVEHLKGWRQSSI